MTKRKKRVNTLSKVDQIPDRALKLVESLKSAREKGKITPSKPMTGRTLAENLNKVFGWKISDSGVRELVNYARSIKKPISIGSEGYGYYYALTSTEMMVTVVDQKSRIAKANEALRGSEECVREMKQLEAFKSNQAAMLGEREREE